MAMAAVAAEGEEVEEEEGKPFVFFLLGKIILGKTK